jgi:hypothetical protein
MPEDIEDIRHEESIMSWGGGELGVPITPEPRIAMLDGRLWTMFSSEAN